MHCQTMCCTQFSINSTSSCIAIGCNVIKFWKYFNFNYCTEVIILHYFHTYITGSGKYIFFENALKETTEYSLKFLFSFESTILPVNNGK